MFDFKIIRDDPHRFDAARAKRGLAPLAEEIVGLDAAESKAVLAAIYDIQGRDEFVYEHVWRAGDLVMWDNRCLVHARTDFPPDQRRLLRRVTISDEYEVMAA